MLKQRVITAVLLVSALLFALFASNPLFWSLVISVMLIAGFYEWLKFCGITSLVQIGVSYVVFLGAGYAFGTGLVPQFWLALLVCLLWGGIFIHTFLDKFEFMNGKWAKLTIGILTLAAAGSMVVEIRTIDSGIYWVLAFFLIVIAADVGAYFSGKKFGKRKLAPAISPGKTVEGFLGGLLLVSLIFIPALFVFFDAWLAIGLSVTVLLTSIASVGGDLYESKLKRFAGLKDSSQILPGHGGILDRVDSLMAGIPVYAMGLLLLGLWR